MFDISTRLVSEQNEISVWVVGESFIEIALIIWWRKSHQFSAHESSTSFRILNCALGRFSKILNLTMHGNEDWDGWTLLEITETFTESTVSQWNWSGIFFRVRYVAAQWRSQKKLQRLERDQILQEQFYFCRCSTTFLVEQKTTKQNVWQTPSSYLCTREDLEKGQWWLGLSSEKSGLLSVKTVHKESGKNCRKDVVGIRWERMSNVPCYDSIVQRSTQKQKDIVNCRFTMQPTRKRLRLFFELLSLQINSVCTEQSQSYVKSMNPFTRVWREPLWWGNRVPHSCSVCSRQKFLWIVMTQRIEMFDCNNLENELRSECCWKWTAIHD